MRRSFFSRKNEDAPSPEADFTPRRLAGRLGTFEIRRVADPSRARCDRCDPFLPSAIPFERYLPSEVSEVSETTGEQRKRGDTLPLGRRGSRASEPPSPCGSRSVHYRVVTYHIFP